MGKGGTEASCYTDTLIRFHETNQKLQCVCMGGAQIHANTFDSPRPFGVIVPCCGAVGAVRIT